MQIDLEQSLEEQTTLLQEVHHRVKNNLQIIISLMKLQLREIPESNRYASAFQDIRNRIYSIALIHELVYEQSSMTGVNVRDYLGTLTDHIIMSQAPSSLDLTLFTDIDPIEMHVDRLLPCGIVTNELITNALEHGLADREKGEIGIEFHRLNDTTYELIVSDDGVGWPEDRSFEDTDSLGLTLVKQLVRNQLNGEIERTNSRDGVAFRILIQKRGIS